MSSRNRCIRCGTVLVAGDSATTCDECSTPSETVRPRGANSCSEITESLASTTDRESFRDDLADGDDLIGRRVGDFLIKEELGRGGMGLVFLAEQLEPVQRQVALKIMRPGLDGEEVLRRFESERRTLAAMEHDHIARVYSAGSLPSGQPYFAMELVRGTGAVRFCDEERASVEDRLALFLDICRAIQHAHQKGIIHRDIKPSNVLVTKDGDRVVPKIIDFGIAKAVHGLLKQSSEETGFGVVLGTLDYMSPEQASAKQQSVDTRADIYSLGALLFELLTGTRVLGSGFDREQPIIDVIAQINDEPIEQPSTRVERDPRVTDASAQRRGLSRKSLQRRLSGDLDAIITKALAKDVAQRYDSVDALVMDVRRHLDGFPVEARGDGQWYRWKSAVGRNRSAISIACLITLLLVTSSVISTWQAVRIGHERDQAGEERERAIAERDKYLQSVDRSDDLFAEIVQFSLQLNEFGAVAPINEEMQAALIRYFEDSLAERQASPDAFDQDTYGFAARCYSSLALLYSWRGEIRKSESAYQKSIDIMNDLLASDPVDTTVQADMARTANNLAVLFQRKLQTERAQVWFERSLEIRESLADQFDSPTDRRNLAVTYSNLGMVAIVNQDRETGVARLVQSEKLFAELVDQTDVHSSPELFREWSTCLMNLGSYHDEPEIRRDYIEEAVRVRRELFDMHGSDLRYGILLTEGLTIIAKDDFANGNRSDAEDRIQEARDTAQRCIEQHPQDPRAMRSMALIKLAYAQMIRAAGNLDVAVMMLEEADELMDGVSTDDWGDDPEHAELVATIVNELAEIYELQRDFARAVEAQREYLAIYDRLREVLPSNERLGVYLFEGWQRLGLIQQSAQQWADAEQSMKRSRELVVEVIAERNPIPIDLLAVLAAREAQIASIQYERRQLDDAQAQFELALELFEELQARHSRRWSDLQNEALTRLAYAKLIAERDSVANAILVLSVAAERQTKVAAEPSMRPGAFVHLLAILQESARLHLQQDELPAAIELIESAKDRVSDAPDWTFALARTAAELSGQSDHGGEADFIDAAFRLLDAARTAGFTEWNQLQDSRFDALRNDVRIDAYTERDSDNHRDVPSNDCVDVEPDRRAPTTDHRATSFRLALGAA